MNPRAILPPATLPNHRTAFTIFELITTIAILGILAALIIPAASSVAAVSRQSKCLSNMRQIALGCILYSNDNNGSFPATWGRINNARVVWSEILVNGGYLDKPPLVMVCPTDPYAAAMRKSALAAGNIGLCGRSYAFTKGTMFLSDSEIEVGAKIRDFKSPSQAFILVENQNPKANWQAVDAYVHDRNTFNSVVGNYGHPSGKRNCAFVDGHVESLTRTEAYNLVHWQR